MHTIVIINSEFSIHLRAKLGNCVP